MTYALNENNLFNVMRKIPEEDRTTKRILSGIETAIKEAEGQKRIISESELMKPLASLMEKGYAKKRIIIKSLEKYEKEFEIYTMLKLVYRG